jgi:4-carboxymuconolactone decarboxylase
LARLSAVAREALPEDQRRFYDAVRAIRRSPVSGPFIVTMNSSPDLAARIAHLGHYFHARGQGDESIVSLRVRGFIALIGARALDGQYEWSAWVNWALEAGVPQETVDAIREGRAPPNLTAEEALVNDFCVQLITGNHRVSAATYKAALEHFGVQGLVELAVTLGYFAMIALPLNAFEIEMAPEQKAKRKPFAPLPLLGEPWTDSGSASRALPSISGAGTAAPRVALLATHDDVPPEHQHFLDRVMRTRGWISGLFQVLLHTPDVAERVSHIGAFLLYESVVPPAARALAALIVARELDCNYVWEACVGAARAAKIDASLIDALEHGKPLPKMSAGEKALFDFCHQLLRGNHHVSEGNYRAAVEQFGVPATVQIAVLLGYCVMVGLVANAFEVAPVRDDSKPAL